MSVSLFLVLLLAQAAKPAAPFKNTLSLQEMTNKQAVVKTTAGPPQGEVG